MSLPLKDAFAVLFFVSVGMLFDPTVLVREPLAVLAVLAIIMVGKSLAAFVIVLRVPPPVRTALTVSASLAQIGEFSFILASLGAALGLLPPDGRDLILAGALLSIALEPVTFAGIAPLTRWLEARPKLLALLERRGADRHRIPVSSAGRLRDHAIVVGYGRVGGAIGPVLKEQGLPFAVIERDHLMLARAQAHGIPTIEGDAAAPGVLPPPASNRAPARRRHARRFPGAPHRRGGAPVESHHRRRGAHALARASSRRWSRSASGAWSWASASWRAACSSTRCAVSACRASARSAARGPRRAR